jgi:hypothetical protein
MPDVSLAFIAPVWQQYLDRYCRHIASSAACALHASLQRLRKAAL